MTYRPCCPQISYPTNAPAGVRTGLNGALSPSAYHAASRTWSAYGDYASNSTLWPGGTVSYPRLFDLDTGLGQTLLTFDTFPSELRAPTTFSQIARDHAGQHYWFIERAQASFNPTQEATVGDLPGPLSGSDEGVYTFELVTVPAGGWTTMVASTEIVHDEGFVGSGGSFFFPNTGTYTTMNNFDVSGLDWSPFDDCLYVMMRHQDSGHEYVSTGNFTQGGYPPANSVMEFWRVDFDGSYEILWSLDNGSIFNTAGPCAVASDGSIWFSTATYPDSTVQIWRHYNGTTTEVVPDGGPYSFSIFGSFGGFGATPWGDMLIPYQTGTYPAVTSHLLMVSPSGEAIEFDCPDSLTGTWFPSGFMRQEDFLKLYVIARAGVTSSFQRIWEIDWKRCGAGWRVGGM